MEQTLEKKSQKDQKFQRFRTFEPFVTSERGVFLNVD